MKHLEEYIWHVLVAGDRFLNTVLGGHADETVSYRAAKRLDLLHWRLLALFLELIDPVHMARTMRNNGHHDFED